MADDNKIIRGENDFSNAAPANEKQDIQISYESLPPYEGSSHEKTKAKYERDLKFTRESLIAWCSAEPVFVGLTFMGAGAAFLPFSPPLGMLMIGIGGMMTIGGILSAKGRVNERALEKAACHFEVCTNERSDLSNAHQQPSDILTEDDNFVDVDIAKEIDGTTCTDVITTTLRNPAEYLYDNLEKITPAIALRLTGYLITTAAGCASVITGILTLFTPAAPAAIPLIVGGVATITAGVGGLASMGVFSGMAKVFGCCYTPPPEPATYNASLLLT